jgi:alkanesulfonate monooxygenase SsuD/methylene tetrahydromethanopterin reductase-like flavin-dependent oxidoreductase (luciferase family)
MMGAVGPRMQELSGEVSDGVYVYLQPVSLMQGIKERVAFSARGAGRDPDAVEVNLMIHTAVDDDLDRARNGARQALTYWLGLPGYNASIAAAGFESEARQIRAAFAEGDQAGIIAGMSDALMDEIAIVGPPGRCMDQIEAIRASGVDLPVLQIDAVSKGESYQEALVRTLAALAPAS